MCTASAGRQSIVVWAALFANLGIGVATFVAAAITGSTAMLRRGFIRS